MQVINCWLEYLDTAGIRYSHSVHPRAATALQTADAERIPAHEFAKVVVYSSDTGFGIAVVAADQLVDLEKIGRMLGRSNVRLATEPELARLFPSCELGAMPPFEGPLDLPVIVDPGIAGEFIAFTIGTHRDIVRMSFADFQRLARPKVASIGVSQHILVSI
jgi:Ala-tRNA(Pro) deacylase